VSVHRSDRKANPYVVRWRDDDGSQRSKSFPTKQDAAHFDREMKQAERQRRENEMLKTILAKFDAEYPTATATELREGARMARAFANADWDEVTSSDLRLMRLQNRLADELERRAEASEEQ
jgi:hypothetical protein